MTLNISRLRWNRIRFLTCLVVLLTGAGLPRLVRAADDAAADVKPLEIASVSVASLDRLADEAKAIGVDLPPFLTAQGIEQQLPFIGAGGLETDKPIGIAFFYEPGWKIDQGQGVVFVLPAKADAAPLKGFLDGGGKAVDGHPDAVNLNGALLRRTEHYLIFSPTADAAIAAKVSALVSLYKAADAGNAPAEQSIARLIFDAKAMRQADPEKYQGFFDQIRSGSPPKNDAERYGQDLVINFIKQLNLIDLKLDKAADELQLKLAVSPLHSPAAGAFMRAAMPAETVVRADLSASPDTLIPPLDQFTDAILKSDPNKLATPEQKAQLALMLKRASEFLGDGQAVSVGIAPQGDAAVVYVVQHQAKPNVDARLNELAAEFNKTSAVMDKADAQTTMDVEHYAAENGTVTRIKIVDQGKPQVYIDAIEKDGNVYLAGAIDAEHHVSEISNLPAGEQMGGLATLDVNLERAFDAANKNAASGLANMPEATRSKIADMVKGRTLRLAAAGQGDGVVFSLGLPEGLIKQVVDMILH